MEKKRQWEKRVPDFFLFIVKQKSGNLDEVLLIAVQCYDLWNNMWVMSVALKQTFMGVLKNS